MVHMQRNVSLTPLYIPTRAPVQSGLMSVRVLVLACNGERCAPRTRSAHGPESSSEGRHPLPVQLLSPISWTAGTGAGWLSGPLKVVHTCNRLTERPLLTIPAEPGLTGEQVTVIYKLTTVAHAVAGHPGRRHCPGHRRV
jgi:hypothetical protein